MAGYDFDDIMDYENDGMSIGFESGDDQLPLGLDARGVAMFGERDWDKVREHASLVAQEAAASKPLGQREQQFSAVQDELLEAALEAGLDDRKIGVVRTKGGIAVDFAQVLDPSAKDKGVGDTALDVRGVAEFGRRFWDAMRRHVQLMVEDSLWESPPDDMQAQFEHMFPLALEALVDAGFDKVATQRITLPAGLVFDSHDVLGDEQMVRPSSGTRHTSPRLGEQELQQQSQEVRHLLSLVLPPLMRLAQLPMGSDTVQEARLTRADVAAVTGLCNRIERATKALDAAPGFQFGARQALEVLKETSRTGVLTAQGHWVATLAFEEMPTSMGEPDPAYEMHSADIQDAVLLLRQIGDKYLVNSAAIDEQYECSVRNALDAIMGDGYTATLRGELTDTVFNHNGKTLEKEMNAVGADGLYANSEVYVQAAMNVYDNAVAHGRDQQYVKGLHASVDHLLGSYARTQGGGRFAQVSKDELDAVSHQAADTEPMLRGISSPTSQDIDNIIRSLQANDPFLEPDEQAATYASEALAQLFLSWKKVNAIKSRMTDVKDLVTDDLEGKALDQMLAIAKMSESLKLTGLSEEEELSAVTLPGSPEGREDIERIGRIRRSYDLLSGKLIESIRDNEAGMDGQVHGRVMGMLRALLGAIDDFNEQETEYLRRRKDHFADSLDKYIQTRLHRGMTEAERQGAMDLCQMAAEDDNLRVSQMSIQALEADDVGIISNGGNTSNILSTFLNRKSITLDARSVRDYVLKTFPTARADGEAMYAKAIELKKAQMGGQDQGVLDDLAVELGILGATAQARTRQWIDGELERQRQDEAQLCQEIEILKLATRLAAQDMHDPDAVLEARHRVDEDPQVTTIASMLGLPYEDALQYATTDMRQLREAEAVLRNRLIEVQARVELLEQRGDVLAQIVPQVATYHAVHALENPKLAALEELRVQLLTAEDSYDKAREKDLCIVSLLQGAALDAGMDADSYEHRLHNIGKLYSEASSAVQALRQGRPGQTLVAEDLIKALSPDAAQIIGPRLVQLQQQGLGRLLQNPGALVASMSPMAPIDRNELEATEFRSRQEASQVTDWDDRGYYFTEDDKDPKSMDDDHNAMLSLELDRLQARQDRQDDRKRALVMALRGDVVPPKPPKGPALSMLFSGTVTYTLDGKHVVQPVSWSYAKEAMEKARSQGAVDIAFRKASLQVDYMARNARGERWSEADYIRQGGVPLATEKPMVSIAGVPDKFPDTRLLSYMWRRLYNRDADIPLSDQDILRYVDNKSLCQLAANAGVSDSRPFAGGALLGMGATDALAIAKAFRGEDPAIATAMVRFARAVKSTARKEKAAAIRALVVRRADLEQPGGPRLYELPSAQQSGDCLMGGRFACECGGKMRVNPKNWQKDLPVLGCEQYGTSGNWTIGVGKIGRKLFRGSGASGEADLMDLRLAMLQQLVQANVISAEQMKMLNDPALARKKLFWVTSDKDGNVVVAAKADSGIEGLKDAQAVIDALDKQVLHVKDLQCTLGPCKMQAPMKTGESKIVIRGIPVKNLAYPRKVNGKWEKLECDAFRTKRLLMNALVDKGILPKHIAQGIASSTSDLRHGVLLEKDGDDNAVLTLKWKLLGKEFPDEQQVRSALDGAVFNPRAAFGQEFDDFVPQIRVVGRGLEGKPIGSSRPSDYESLVEDLAISSLASKMGTLKKVLLDELDGDAGNDNGNTSAPPAPTLPTDAKDGKDGKDGKDATGPKDGKDAKDSRSSKGDGGDRDGR